MIALTMVQPAAPQTRTARHATAPRVASVATLTTKDFRVAVVARRLNGGATPTADVRVAVARRVGGAWREWAEKRLDETYFWHTVIGPRSVCRLEIATPARPISARLHVTVQLLQSPSLGCGLTYRVPLPSW